MPSIPSIIDILKPIKELQNFKQKTKETGVDNDDDSDSEDNGNGSDDDPLDTVTTLPTDTPEESSSEPVPGEYDLQLWSHSTVQSVHIQSLQCSRRTLVNNSSVVLLL